MQEIFSELGSSFQYALIVTLPNLILLALGVFLKKTHQIDEAFCTQATKLVFHYGLPLLLFTSLVQSDINYGEQSILLAAGFTCTLLLFFGAEIFAWKFIPAPEDKGVFVQGVFRSNMGILGLSMVQNAYGTAGLAGGAVYMGVITILYNILAVITLSRTQQGSLSEKIKKIFKGIITNPLIVAIVIALVLQRLNVQMPQVVMQTGKTIAHISLPLALICAGATFNFAEVTKLSGVTFQASIGRLVIAPIMAILTGLLFGLRGIPMGIIFLMTTTSVAAASYVMVRAMGSNHVAAANILAVTTLGASFSAALGIMFLRIMGWM